MKSITKFMMLALMLASFSTTTFAQKSKAATEAHVQYTITAEGGMASMITGSTLELFFNANNAKVVANMMSGMVKVDARMDGKTKTGMMLMDMMGQKKVVQMDDKAIKDAEEKSKETNEKPTAPEIEYINKYKKIAGYKCQMAKMTSEGMSAIVYITEKIMPANFGEFDFMKMTGLKGFPLAWEINEQGNSVKMEATAVSLDKLPKTTFDMTVPDGYEKMNMEDLQNMGGTFGL
jgi:GLPGLI family protein